MEVNVNLEKKRWLIFFFLPRENRRERKKEEFRKRESDAATTELLRTQPNKDYLIVPLRQKQKYNIGRN